MAKSDWRARRVSATRRDSSVVGLEVRADAGLGRVREEAGEHRGVAGAACEQVGVRPTAEQPCIICDRPSRLGTPHSLTGSPRHNERPAVSAVGAGRRIRGEPPAGGLLIRWDSSTIWAG